MSGWQGGIQLDKESQEVSPTEYTFQDLQPTGLAARVPLGWSSALNSRRVLHMARPGVKVA